MLRNVKPQILNAVVAGKDEIWSFWLIVFLIAWESLEISFTSTMMMTKTPT
tara:strand:- start:784 stop:936 length:153 start_codon:yes stop_codon:yes gene_type:complete